MTKKTPKTLPVTFTPNSPNTNAILGAALSGGDWKWLAEQLASAKKGAA